MEADSQMNDIKHIHLKNHWILMITIIIYGTVSGLEHRRKCTLQQKVPSELKSTTTFYTNTYIHT